MGEVYYVCNFKSITDTDRTRGTLDRRISKAGEINAVMVLTRISDES